MVDRSGVRAVLTALHEHERVTPVDLEHLIFYYPVQMVIEGHIKCSCIAAQLRRRVGSI